MKNEELLFERLPAGEAGNRENYLRFDAILTVVSSRALALKRYFLTSSA